MNIRININCIYNDSGAWCTNKNIKRSLCGIGARCCVIHPFFTGHCEYQEKHLRPKCGPPAPQNET
jgi:hypothetical protein